MNLIEKLKESFKKNKKKELPKEIVNKYRVNDDYYKYEYNTNQYIYLRILDNLELEDYSNLYRCNIDYGSANRTGVFNAVEDKALKCFNKVIIGIDKEKMINDEQYAGYVLSTLLERNRIIKLHDIEFDIVKDESEPKCGNYVGSIVESDNNLSIFVDDKIGNIIENSEESKSLREQYKNYVEEEKAKEVKDKQDRIVKEQAKVDTMHYDIAEREKRIQELKATLEELQTTTEQAINNNMNK